MEMYLTTNKKVHQFNVRGTLPHLCQLFKRKKQKKIPLHLNPTNSRLYFHVFVLWWQSNSKKDWFTLIGRDKKVVWFK